MLRSMYSGVSGMRANQTKLDVTGNNIANVNTTGYKSSSTAFTDTFSQMISSGNAPGAVQGGTNPAQVGLGVQVAGVITNFTQGAAQVTGRSTDMMIQGDGFFIVSQGGQNFYTRSGAFDFDAQGNLVTQGGAFVQGYAAVNGVVQENGVIGPLQIQKGALFPAQATTQSTFGGNLPSDVAVGETIVRELQIFDNLGSSSILALSFTKTAAGWDLSMNGGAAQAMTFDAATGALTSANVVNYAGPAGNIAIDLSGVSGFASLNTIEMATIDGQAAGVLQSFQVSNDGTIVGAFSNGSKRDLGRVAVANFVNPGGLEKAGDSLFTTSVNSGEAQVGTAGLGGRGKLAAGAIEMSNVDLSEEMVSLVTAQRALQSSSRVITTSDEILNELVNLKR